jgi:hypothetical protein
MERRGLTAETFARWSFERDLAAGCYDDPDEPVVKVYEDLDEETRKSYMEEAAYYLANLDGDWPKDIDDRLAGRPVTFP